MFNPLLENLSSLKDTDLEERVSDLNRKYTIALKMGNASLAQQVLVIIEALKEETARRQRESTKKVLQKQNKDLYNLINIG